MQYFAKLHIKIYIIVCIRTKINKQMCSAEKMKKSAMNMFEPAECDKYLMCFHSLFI